MTHAELRGAVERAVAGTPFVPPISVAYCEQVRDALRKEVQAGTFVEAYYRVASRRGPASLHVKAQSGETRYELAVTLP